MKKNLLIFVLFSYFFAQNLKAQLFVDSVYSAEQMITDFFGGTGNQISNITYTGTLNAIGFFDAGNTNIDVNGGILITTGSISNAVNNLPGSSQMNQGNSDPDLDSLVSGLTTKDASIIEFDIIPGADTLSFNYVFASNEYDEWVNAGFNDVFGFFISGPGIIGVQNLALIPDTNIFVSINNVNCSIFSQYYQCNNIGSICTTSPTILDSTVVKYDGFTTRFNAIKSVIPGALYHIKIAIADVNDDVIDSGVFIDVSSLDGGDSIALSAGMTTIINGNEIQFNPTTKYASKYFWDFGDGTISKEKNPSHLFNELSENYYQVKLVVSNFSDVDSTIQFFGDPTASLLQKEYENLSISPNPGQNELFIHLHNPINTSIVSIHDDFGQEIFSSSIETSLTVNTQKWIPGIYTIRLIIHDSVIVKKFVRI